MATGMPAAQPSPPALLRAIDWQRPVVADILLVEFALTPDHTFVVGQPTRLQIHNIGEVAHVFSSPGFFGAVAVRTVVHTAASPAPKAGAYSAAKMEEIAFTGITNIIALTPHEQDQARTSRNPFDRPPAPPTPIDFGDLLGDLGAFGADPFGLNRPASADPFGLGGGAGATPPGAATTPPANPFDILGLLGQQPPAPAAATTAVTPPPVPSLGPPEAAAVEPGLAPSGSSNFWPVGAPVC